MPKIRLADVLSIPNVISAVGLGLVLHGSARLDTTKGLTETVVGRMLDLVDGKVARMLNQNSEFGAGVDAAFDKAGIIAIGINQWRGNIAPKPALLAIAMQNAVNLMATVVATKLGGDDDLAPVADGKIAMTWQNGALGAYAVSALLRQRSQGWSRAFRLIGDADTVIGTGYFGVRASRQYVARALVLVRARR